jgi:hypothetical protein
MLSEGRSRSSIGGKRQPVKQKKTREGVQTLRREGQRAQEARPEGAVGALHPQATAPLATDEAREEGVRLGLRVLELQLAGV